MANISYQIEGLERLIKKTSPELLATPLRHFFERATLAVANHAKERAPVDTGRLRSSIATRVDSGSPPTWGEAGTNVFYAPMMEYGTGLMSDGPGGHSRHWPPGDALETWASRHGFASGYAVAAAIGKRGGLRPRRFLRGGLEAAVGEIRGFVERLGAEIQSKWGER